MLATLRNLSGELAVSLRGPNEAEVASILNRARGTQGLVDKMHEDMGAGREIGLISPLYWLERPRLERISATGAPIDNCMRNFRVVARRALGLTQRGVRVEPAVLDLIAALPEGFEILREMMLAPPKGSPDGADAARVLRTIVRQARPALQETRALILEGDGDFSEVALMVELRSLLLDMLMVAGLKRESAIAQLRLD